MSELLIWLLWGGNRQLNHSEWPERTYFVLLTIKGFLLSDQVAISIPNIFQTELILSRVCSKQLYSGDLCLHIEYIRYILGKILSLPCKITYHCSTFFFCKGSFIQGALQVCVKQQYICED